MFQKSVNLKPSVVLTKIFQFKYIIPCTSELHALFLIPFLQFSLRTIVVKSVSMCNKEIYVYVF
jgi:hypothetical protein